MERFDVGELFSVALEEGSAGEQDLCVDDVVFDGGDANIYSLNPQSACFIDLSKRDIRFLLLGSLQVLLLTLSQSQTRI